VRGCSGFQAAAKAESLKTDFVISAVMYAGRDNQSERFLPSIRRRCMYPAASSQAVTPRSALVRNLREKKGASHVRVEHRARQRAGDRGR